MGQRQVLLVADANFAERIFLGEVGDRVHLVGGGIAGRSAHGLQRQRHDRIARHFVRKHGVLAPCLEMRVVRRLLQLFRHMWQLFVRRIAEARTEILDHGIIDRQGAVAHLQPLFLDFLRKFFDAEFVRNTRLL